MSKLSTKLRQKQSIVPQQIIKSRLLELSIDELEKELENEIQVNINRESGDIEIFRKLIIVEKPENNNTEILSLIHI